MTSSKSPARPTSPSNSFYAMSDDDEGDYNTIAHTSSGRGVKLLYSKSKASHVPRQREHEVVNRPQVYIHPTPSAKDNIPGYIALLQQKPVPDSRPASSSSTPAKAKTSASLLLAWVPEHSLGDARDTYVKVDMAEGDSPPKQSFLVPPPPTTTTTTTSGGSLGHYAFAIPVSAVYSLLVRPPSLGWWFGSVIINSRAGDSFPALFFHDSECQSTILQKKRHARENFDPFGANGEMFWGGDEVLRWLRRYVDIERSGAEPNIYLIEPSFEDKEAFGGKPVTAARVRPSSSGANVTGAAGSGPSGSRNPRDAAMDPVTKFVKEAGWNLMERFSKVTTFTRRTADAVIDNPKMPPQMRRLLKNPEVQTLQEEFDSARIYLARWAMGMAEQSERDRNQRIWTARDVLEMEETDVGEFELLDTEMGSLSLKEKRRTVTRKEWNSFFDPRTGRLSVTIDEVKERIFHGGLDADDGVRKEAWLFLLEVYDWHSTAEERTAETARLRDEYVKLKGAWWDRLVDLDRNIPLFAGEDTPHPDPSSPFADVGTNVHLEQMKDMLLTYNEYNRDLGYVQGMSDLLAPIYAVMQDDAIACSTPVGMNELSTTIDLESTLVRAEALFRRFQRTVEAFDKKSNFPAPKLRKRTTAASPPSSSVAATPVADTSSIDTTTAGGTNSGSAAAGGPSPNAGASVSGGDSKSKGKARAKGKGEELEEQRPKVISAELRGLLSRNVEVLPRKVVRKEGEGLASLGK
ncbi:GTPase-activating protein GYP7 [Diplocarpon rosae]|nr:GTPase-activating protein GYP7 [Diplocarpon rosae]